jgi:putative oxidoreductase
MSNNIRIISLNLLRIVTGLLFVPHGYQKLFADQPPELTSTLGIAGILELFGGTLIVLGLRTRTIAFLLSGQMAVAFWTAHAPRSPWPIANGGELAVLFCFIFLFLSAHGGGTWSIDGLLQKRKR